MGAVRIRIRDDVEAMGMKVRHMGRVLPIEVSLQAPTRTNFRIDNLKNLLGKIECNTNVFYIYRIFGQRADLAVAVGCHINGVGAGAHLRLLLVEAEHVADFDPEDAVASYTHRRARTGPIVAK